MTKEEFKNALLAEGFICEKSGNYPAVVCDAKDVRNIAKKVKAIAKDKEYTSSFAIRCYREGMELISKDGVVSWNNSDTVNQEEVGEEPVLISEPIPMTAVTEDVSA